jgi:2-oxoglutarate ferredoxin oxidoreductase subunit alpha
MVMGAAAAGVRAMTSSSSPGISLKQEAISYLAGMELPAVIVNMVRGGPGLGNISPSQADYFQATRGGGHGDYRTLVLAPSTVQELADLTVEAFDQADRWRMPVLVLGDGLLGQMMEPLVLPPMRDPSTLPVPPWALRGAAGRAPNVIHSLYLAEGELEKHNARLEAKYRELRAEARGEYDGEADDRLVVAAFGSAARIARSAVRAARARGMKVGLYRPVTLWPFPYEDLRRRAAGKVVLTAEMNLGQMVEDVRLALCGEGSAVHFHGRPGGAVLTPAELSAAVERHYPT